MFRIELDAVGSPPQTSHRKLFQVCSGVAPAEFTRRTTNIFDVYAFLMEVLCRSIARQPRHVRQTCSDNNVVIRVIIPVCWTFELAGFAVIISHPLLAAVSCTSLQQTLDQHSELDWRIKLNFAASITRLKMLLNIPFVLIDI